MKSRRQLYLFITIAALLTACSSTAPQYVMKPDLDYMQKVETSSKYSTSAARVYWVNPPMKRELISEKVQN